eukprot:4628717-Amphidinium_carterae.1
MMMGVTAACTDEDELEMELGAEVDSTPMLCTVATAKTRRGKVSIVLTEIGPLLSKLARGPRVPDPHASSMPLSVVDNAKGTWNEGAEELHQAGERKPEEELKLCRCCMGEKPLSEFDIDAKGRVKGAMCSQCGAASEALQRMLRQVWGSQYRTRYQIFKSKQHADTWRSVVVSMGKDPTSQKRRALKITSEVVTETTRKGVTKREEAETEPLTWEAYHDFFAKAKHGGFSQQQNAANWQELIADKTVRRDREGVAGGVRGQLRLWVQTREKAYKGKEEWKGRAHEQSHGSKSGRLEDEDVRLFMEEAGTDGEEHMVLAHEVAKGGILVPSSNIVYTLVNNIEVALNMEVTVDPSAASSSGCRTMSQTSKNTTSSIGAASAAGGSGTLITPVKEDAAEKRKREKWARDSVSKISETVKDYSADTAALEKLLEESQKQVAATRRKSLVESDVSIMNCTARQSKCRRDAQSSLMLSDVMNQTHDADGVSSIIDCHALHSMYRFPRVGIRKVIVVEVDVTQACAASQRKCTEDCQKCDTVTVTCIHPKRSPYSEKMVLINEAVKKGGEAPGEQAAEAGHAGGDGEAPQEDPTLLEKFADVLAVLDKRTVLLCLLAETPPSTELASRFEKLVESSTATSWENYKEDPKMPKDIVSNFHKLLPKSAWNTHEKKMTSAASMDELQDAKKNWKACWLESV